MGRSESRPEHRPDNRPDNRPEIKPERSSDTGPENRPENRPEAKPGSRIDRRARRRLKIEGYLNLVRVNRELEARAAQLLEDEGVSGMTLAQATALLVLVQERAPITAARLAELLNVSPVTVGRFVRSLEQNKWLRRRQDPRDARAMLLEPTRKTLDSLQRFFRVTNRLMEEAYAGLGERELTLVLEHLAVVRRNLYHAAGKPDLQPQVVL